MPDVSFHSGGDATQVKSHYVGPLARMNVADRCGTPGADQELAEFHELQRTAVQSSFHYHHARLIEIMYCIEAWSSC
jgi:NAD-reducing hydrogenase large subunit